MSGQWGRVGTGHQTDSLRLAGQGDRNADLSWGSGQQLAPGEGGGMQAEDLALDSTVRNLDTEAKDLRAVRLGRRSQRNKARLA